MSVKSRSTINVPKILGSLGVIIVNDHFVYTSGRHGRAYVNKDALYPHTVATSNICCGLADAFERDRIDVVVAPAVGGIALSQWTAYHLTNFGDPNHEVLSTYAERDETSLLNAEEYSHSIGLSSCRTIYLEVGEELVVKKPQFVLKRGYAQLVAGKRVLIVEDILTTGGTVAKVVQATKAALGEVVGVGALCNRGNVTAQMLDVPKLHSLLDVRLDSWSEEECLSHGPCSEGVPVNAQIGKGSQFLARTQGSR
jgi:orotate phosphoribosyltransferase